jgi:LysM repeat protein
MTYNTSRRSFEGFVLLMIVVIPLSVHAGVFSVIFAKESTKVSDATQVEQVLSAQTVPLLKAAINSDPNPVTGGGDIIVEDGALVPDGEIGVKEKKVNTRTANGEISVYVVREGDTLSQIAEMYDVSAKTILWANNIANAATIKPGDALVILPITGVRHVVKSGDTIASIAKKYSGDAEEILSYNQLASASELGVGDTILIPDGTISAPQPAKTATPKKTTGTGAVASGAGSAGFTHPLPGSVRTQGIHGYNGVDLAAGAGTPILAAAAGEVIVAKSAGWNGGYGNYVVIKHANGAQTLYAHNSSNAVAAGDRVVQGEVIGYVGNTGRSTGNHLHFEVRGAKNPF